MNAQLETAIANLVKKGDALGRAITSEQELEDDRAAIKADAILRVMERDGVAATRAEKVVETDHEYFHHRAKQRMSIVARYKADAEYWAAKCEATQASLITPDVFALSAEVDDLTEANLGLATQTVELVNARNETREANAELVQANRELAEQLVAANETINASRFTRNELITMSLTPINAEATP